MTYEVYAIRYGHHDRPSSDNFIGGDAHDVLQPLDYFVWAIVGPGGPFIVDTGFDAATGKKRQREMLNPVAEGLKAIDIRPDQVSNVIVSCTMTMPETTTFARKPATICRLLKWNTSPGAACATHTCANLSRSMMSSPWCARSLPVA